MHRFAGIRRNLETALGKVPVVGALKSENGFAMEIAVVIIMIMSLIGLSMLTTAMYQHQDADRTVPSNRAFDLAQCGVSYGKAWLAQDNIPGLDGEPNPKQYDGEVGSPASRFDVEVLLTSASHYTITSTGTYTQDENGTPRLYKRKLEETLTYSGGSHHFDAFTYVLFSKNGDIYMDGGWFAVNFGDLNINGNVYARNVTLRNYKVVAATGTVSVNGDVFCKTDSQGGGGTATLYSETIAAAYAGVKITGNLWTDGNVSVTTKTTAAAGARSEVQGTVSSRGSVTVGSTVAAFAGNTARVGGNVNANGNVNLSATSGFASGATSEVGGNVNAGGSVDLYAADTALAGSYAHVSGTINAIGTANIRSYCTVAAWPQSEAGAVNTNSTSLLRATSANIWGVGVGFNGAKVDGVWNAAGAHSEDTTWPFCWTSHGTEQWIGGVTAPAVQPVPEVVLPQPDWNWYRTTAIGQDGYGGVQHYYTGSSSYNIDTIRAEYDFASSGEVYYFDNDLTITNTYIDPSKKGVLVVNGDVNVGNEWQMNNLSEMQIIATGDISFATRNNMNWFGSYQKVFLYTNGTHIHGGTQRAGNVTYDLGWFRSITGQMTCTGSIITPSAGVGNVNHAITYYPPSVPVEAWPIPMPVSTFRELTP